ncbi:cysteine desulfurase family protein (TIGR01976 family) [Saccharothrix saharensis]|uniref:Cysteine desulfurase family protein (TIGR01976 family) n=1 Tax=Saccharothrix saharensis TaxID=571190 RepID=A0A543J8E1_9PSEU|nr:cysteine desulfurase-like protein [Saccharothrix saharensis]TQM79081.1 cysteine desulfurase family protein (TIGR01976 family) [Saccharothrix saharensis]
MTYDVESVRARFPSLATGTAHFDGPGGSQVPAPVADAVRDAMVSPLANRGTVTAAERAADAIVLDARRALADLLGASPEGVVFGRSMTQLTYDFARALARTWSPGDEVVVTRLDHDANVRPWVQAAEAVGAVVRWVGFDPATGELDDVAEALSDRTRLVAVTAASNLIGTRPELARIGAQAHERGALFYVDGVHYTAHHPVDVAAIGADFFACSPYKFFGPHCGVVAGRPEVLADLRPDKLLPSSDAVPERFELGTLPYEVLAGCTAAVDFIAGLAPSTGTRRDRIAASLAVVGEHEDRLRDRVEAGLAELPGAVVWSRARLRTPTVLVTFAEHAAADAYRYLAGVGVNAPASSFYAIETSRWLGLGDAGGLRVGLAPYSTEAEVDRLLDGLAAFLRSTPGT